MNLATLLAILLATPALQFAQDKCEKYKAVPIPEADKPTPAQLETLKDCESVILYYGLYDVPSDPAQARLCAFTETAEGRHTPDLGQTDQPGTTPYFWGPAILMMVYANGNGATRNLDLALRFACEVDPTGRIQHLEQMKAQNWKGTDYDFCDADHPTNTDMDAYCEGKNSNVAAVRRKKQLAAIVAKWSAEDQEAFAQLRSAANEFFETKSEVEVDQSDNYHSRMMPIPHAKLEDDFLASLIAFESGKTPKFTAADFAKADANLNAVYKQTLKKAAAGKGTIKEDGIRSIEHLWLAYLTAWVTFAHQKYPQVTADSWRVWLTRERTQQLRELDIRP